MMILKMMTMATGASVTGLDYTLKTLQVSTTKGCFLLRGEKFVNIDSASRSGSHGGVLLQTGIGESGLRALLLSPQNGVAVAEIKSGEIISRISFEESMKTNHPQIPLINPANIVSEETSGSPMLHMAILCQAEQVLVLWNQLAMHLVSLKDSTVMASCYSFRSILDLAVTEEGEIFVLESGRSLARLAKTEDPHRAGEDWRQGGTSAQAPDSQLAASVEGLGAGLARRLPSLHHLTASLPLQPFASGWLERAERSLTNKISPVEQATEACGELGFDETSKTTDAENDFKSRMDRIGELSFGPLLSKKSTKSPKSLRPRSPRPRSPGIQEADLNEIDPLLLPEPDPPVAGADLRLAIHLEDSPSLPAHPAESIGQDSPEPPAAASQERNLSDDEKERTLMKILKLDKALEDLGSADVDKEPEKQSLPEEKEYAPQSSEGVYSRCTSLQYGPPSDSSAHRVSIVSSKDVSLNKESQRLEPEDKEESSKVVGGENSCETALFSEIEQEMEVFAEELSQGRYLYKQGPSESKKVFISEGWFKFLLPGPVGHLCHTENLLWFSDASENVFVADVHQLPNQLRWRKTGKT